MFAEKVIHIESAGKPRARLFIIYTGGTFGMTYTTEGVLVPFDFESILEHLPVVRNMGLSFSVSSFQKPIDSSNIKPDHWKAIAEEIRKHYHNHDGFVILHGTDTMAYTASALSFMLENLAKPVILTGAQLPVSDPRSDARENLITALEIASASENGRPVVPEVCIYFDYQLLRGNRSRKVESMQFDAFDSGNYPPLAKAGVKIDYNYNAIRPYPDKPLVVNDKLDNRIALLRLFPGITPEVVQGVLQVHGLRALVLETYGAGNAPSDNWLIDALRKAIEGGLIVVNISQCPGGRVVQGRYQTSRELQHIGVIGGADMTTEAAVTKLMVLLAKYELNDVKQKLSENLAGELIP
jgi:L-asparaginase